MSEANANSTLRAYLGSLGCPGMESDGACDYPDSQAMGRYLRFQLERWLQRGVLHQLLFAASLIAAISILGGFAALTVSDAFEGPLDAIWWSFLRLSDPGYLGDDEGAGLRFISTVVTVLGYVLFLGSLVAIMTQWLSDTLSRFEQGISPISMQGHVVILGWTNRTLEIARQLLAARGRLRRFLDTHQQRHMRIVIVADEVNAARRGRLRSHLSEYRDCGQVFLRSGSATIVGDLARFDLSHASVVIVPGDAFRYGGAESSDARVVQSLLNLRSSLDTMAAGERPLVLAEVLDAGKARAATHAYAGPIEIVSGDGIIARLLAQAILNPRLAAVFLSMFTHNEGCSPFIRACPEFAGQHPLALDAHLERAVVIGVLRHEAGTQIAQLNPPADFRLDESDQVVFIAPGFDDCDVTAVADRPADDSPLPPKRQEVEVRLLVLGWSPHLDQVIEHLLIDEKSKIDLTLVSRIPLDERRTWRPGRNHARAQVEVEHVEADIIAAGTLTDLDLRSFDSILLVASPHRESAEKNDARVLTAYEMLKVELDIQCRSESERPTILLELSHPSSSHIAAGPGDVLFMRPRLLGFLQAHVALQPDLQAVYEALFVPSGRAQLALRRCPDDPAPKRFDEFARISQARGDIALGVILDGGTSGQEVVLCPAPGLEWSGTAELIVLSSGSAHD